MVWETAILVWLMLWRHWTTGLRQCWLRGYYLSLRQSLPHSLGGKMQELWYCLKPPQLSDYLTDRYAQAQLDCALSERIPVTSGVPQGSVLGSILFLLFVNDIPELIHSSKLTFASDIKIWARVENVEDCFRMQLDLDALSYGHSIINYYST